MKKIFLFIPAAAIILGACTKDEETTWEKYRDWRETNNAWLEEMQAKKNPDGTDYYKVLIPEWNPGSFVLIHYINDRKETEGNLSPLYTSTCDTRYTVRLYNGTGVDSSLNISADGIYQSRVNSNVQGWAIALQDMRCGDTAQVIMPYGVAYGAQSSNAIPPYSNLQFNIRLVDIPYYEATPF